ncbi:MAG TPA: hypothetical protein VN026_10355 [Bacteroidia bacterium]|jgi:hypothetical protein|nr:hypothetical protein [Bacteroidia bacterium]
MNTLFILCQHQQANSNWALGIPIIAGIIVFVLNVFYQNHIRKQQLIHELSNNLIYVCDKLLRYAVAYEQSALNMRYYDEYDRLHPNIKKYETLFYHYYKKAEDAGREYDMMRAELKKSVKNLYDYWENDVEKHRMLNIMKKVVLINKRGFKDVFIEKYTDVNAMLQAKTTLMNNIAEEVLFNGVGIHLVKIQKIIDPETPTLYVSEKLENKLNEAIRNYKY